MEYWQLILIIGIVFLIVEMFTPALFFLNFALSCFITAVLALFIVDLNVLIPFFVMFSALFLIFLRPLLVRNRNGKKETGVEDKYIGKIAKVTETVTSKEGSVSIYDERWNARSCSGEDLAVDTEVKIIRNDNLIFYVEKI